MVNEKMDKPKLLAYVLGELDRDETAQLARIIEQDPELKKEVLSLQSMTQKLDATFIETEDFQLKDSQKQMITSRARTRSAQKKWIIFASAFATLAIVSIMTLNQQVEQQAFPPARELVAQPPPTSVEETTASRSEAQWQDEIAAAEPPASPPADGLAQTKGRGAQQIARNEPSLAKKVGSAKAKLGSNSKETSGLLSAFGGKGGASNPHQEIAMESGDSRFESFAEDSAQAPPSTEEVRPHHRIQADPHLSSLPAAFQASLLSTLIANLDNSGHCFTGRPLPSRTDLTVVVSGKGHVLSVNLVPSIPNNGAAVACLEKRIQSIGSLLKPKNGKNAQFKIRLNLK